jgi:hypothetical protein
VRGGRRDRRGRAERGGRAVQLGCREQESVYARVASPFFFHVLWTLSVISFFAGYSARCSVVSGDERALGGQACDEKHERKLHIATRSNTPQFVTRCSSLPIRLPFVVLDRLKVRRGEEVATPLHSRLLVSEDGLRLVDLDGFARCAREKGDLALGFEEDEPGCGREVIGMKVQ